MTPLPPLLTHDAFDDVERLAAHVERIYDPSVPPQGIPSLAVCVSLDGEMTASWDFIEIEEVRHAAMMHALQAQGARNLVRQPADEALHSFPTRSRPKDLNAIDVEARAVCPSDQLPDAGH